MIVCLTRRAPLRVFPMLLMLLTTVTFSPAAVRAQTSKDPPLSPAPVTAKQTGVGEITVTWKAVPGAVGYAIGRSVWPNGYQRFRPNYPPENTLVDKDVTAGVAHRYRIIALLPNDRTSEAAASNLLTPTENVPTPDPDPAPGGGSGTPGGGSGTPGGGTGGAGGGGGTGTPGGGGSGGSGNTGGTGGGGTGGGGTSGGTGGGTTAAAARGRFRVTIAGFKVLQETDDNPTQIDGQRDEVFITASVTDLAPSPKGAVNRSFRTRTFGDTRNFSQRIKAGTSHAMGGLRSGDTYLPDGGKGSTASMDRLPLRVFDGELVQGGPASVIMPIIWEEDLERSALNEWDSVVSSPNWAPLVRQTPLVGNTGYKILQLVEMLKPFATQLPGIGPLIASVFNRFDRSTMDRPIGLEVASGKRVFNPRVIPLNYELADQIVREGGNGRSARIQIPFEDKDPPPAKGAADPKGAVNTSWLGGRYVLFVDVERVP